MIVDAIEFAFDSFLFVYDKAKQVVSELEEEIFCYYGSGGKAGVFCSKWDLPHLVDLIFIKRRVGFTRYMY